MNLYPGKYKFHYNVGNGDVRTYDIFPNGNIIETIARTNESGRVGISYTQSKLDEMISLSEKKAQLYKKIPFYSKTSNTQLNILLDIKTYLNDLIDG